MTAMRKECLELSSYKVRMSKRLQEEVLILRVKGRLDTMSSQKFEKQIEKQIKIHSKICLNLNGLEYISSIGVKTLLALTVKARSALGMLMICNASPFVDDVIKMTGLYRRLLIAQDEDEALQKLNE